MLEYIDSINENDWMTIVLRCPTCGGKLKFKENGLQCSKCNEFTQIIDGIPLFKKPPSNKKEYLFEMNRYNNIALKPPETYYGFDDSYPNERINILKPYLKDKILYLNVGQGFGQLEKSMPYKSKICLDQCIEFLKYCQKQNIPNIRYVMGFGERTPFNENYFPAVVSDSVFQTLVDQREFLVEQARILKPKGIFLLTITYKWNYPRKPQDFYAKQPDLLIHFLDELGIKAKAIYRNLSQNKITDYENGDFLLIAGVKN